MERRQLWQQASKQEHACQLRIAPAASAPSSKCMNAELTTMMSVNSAMVAMMEPARVTRERALVVPSSGKAL